MRSSLLESRICCCSVTQSCSTLHNPWTAGHQAFLSFTVSQTFLRFMSIELVMLSNHLILFWPLLFLLSCFPALGPFPMSWLFVSDGQSIGPSALASVLPMDIQGWFPLGLTGLISLQSNGLLRVFPSTTIWRHQLFGAQPSLWSNCHIHIVGHLLIK